MRSLRMKVIGMTALFIASLVANAGGFFGPWSK